MVRKLHYKSVVVPFANTDAMMILAVSGNRSLIEQHIAALQFLCLYLINITLIIVNEVGAQILEAQEVGIQTATSLSYRHQAELWVASCHIYRAAEHIMSTLHEENISSQTPDCRDNQVSTHHFGMYSRDDCAWLP